jgi:hypothetical protein
MRRVFPILLALAAPLLLAACQSSVFRQRPPLKSMVVTERCVEVPHP